MGQEGIGFKPGMARVGLMTRSRTSRGRQIQKTCNSMTLTVLCGFVTLLVLRGSIGVVNITGSSPDSVMEDIDRILSDIRSDTEPDSYNPYQYSSLNLTFAEAVALVNYSIGPKVSNWDEQRKNWLAQNPNFPNHSPNGKPKILLVTGSPPSPCDNPMGDHYLLKTTKNKIDYCRLHGIEIVHNMALLDPELTDYWAKMPLVRKLMLSHPEAEWIWWMDNDALFTDMAFELPLEKYKNHNLIVHGYPDLLEKHSWIALNAGIYVMRNCQWSLDLMDAWAPMGPKGIVRDEAGKIVTANLKGRPLFEADDQSALIYLLITQQNKWMDRVYIENSYYLHGFWAGLVDKYEEMMERNHPGLGDERWPFITHFVGCKPCGSYGDYPVEKCLNSMERAFNFADNQILRLYGFAHQELLSPKIKRVRNQTANPLDAKENLNMEAKIITS
ncbi:hypothetical protein LUZ60_017768 [Juncus effusus]|nr:hypothetical protein LUZ60_017768 [Juncus effusus]